jgi:cell wall-associated NlpC family hydrolase
MMASAAIVCGSVVAMAPFAVATPVRQQMPADNTPLAAAAAPVQIVAPAAVTDPAAGYAISAFNALQKKDSTAYATAIQQLAKIVAPRASVTVNDLIAAWNGGTPEGMTAMLAGLTQLGVGYGFAAATPWTAFDCSGLTSWAWGLAGVSLPHQSLLIITQVTPKAVAQVKPGDVLYYPGHVMISLGVGTAIVHAANAQLGVEVSSVDAREVSVLQAGAPSAATGQTGVAVAAPVPDTWMSALAREKRVLTPKSPAAVIGN